MFKFTELKQIHLEITNNCQASCPMCTRNIHGGLENPNIKITNWSLDRYKTIITPEVINQVESLYFCGNYGDPLINNDLAEMIQYSVEVKPSIGIRVHTNGSLRNKEWWKQLAYIMPKDHVVVFALDGLEDTHALYRIGTSFSKILENAKAFIDAGGKAEWAYIRFKHNEHQVEEAKQIATNLGFSEFVMKDSSRWLLDSKFPVLDKSGDVSYNLEPSQYSTIKIIDKSIIENYRLIISQTKIKCHALTVKEVYIDSFGHLFPCCWLAMIPYQPDDRELIVHDIRRNILEQYHNLVDSFGGIDNLDATKHSVNDIISSDAYQTVWDFYWNEAKLITCARACGVQPELFSTPGDQFITRNILKIQ
jgi:MoaA/NifB/PqqE/SkfB family radical SAM enzyme